MRIESPLPPDECRRRIEASFDGPLGGVVWSASATRVMLGRLDGDEIRVTLTGRRETDFGPIVH